MASRGDDGQITFRDWHPVGVEEYGYVAPDPLEPGYHLRRQGHAVRPPHRPGPERRAGSGAQRQVSIPAHRSGAVLAGRSARALPRRQRAVQDDERRAQAGTSSAPTCRARSPTSRRASASIRTRRTKRATAPRRDLHRRARPTRTSNTIWAGTDDGLIHVTRDGGKTWTNVTPPGLTPWSKVSLIDAGRIRRRHGLRRGQSHPLRRPASRTSIARTTAARPGGRSSGASRQRAGQCRPRSPVRKGLLFAGTERYGSRLLQRRR